MTYSSDGAVENMFVFVTVVFGLGCFSDKVRRLRSIDQNVVARGQQPIDNTSTCFPPYLRR